MYITFESIVNFIRSHYKTPEGFIPLHAPLFAGHEKRYVLDAIDSTYVSSVGKYVDKFEQIFREYTGASHAIATVNGTSALHISLLLSGVEEGDLVVTQPLTFIATCNAISYVGAKPLFIDIDRTTLGLSWDKLKNYLRENARLSNGNCYHKPTGKRISACVPMHTFGHPVDLNGLLEVCEEFKIALVEDAAESLGTYYHKKHSGTYGLLGAFSFNGNKIITCGGGGMIVTNNERLGRLAKHLTTQAKVPHAYEFVHDRIGYNYRLPNLNAAMACAQMEVLDKLISSKRDLAKKYKAFFSSSEIEFVDEPEGASSNFWLNSILFSNPSTKEAFLHYSNEQSIMTRPAWRLMNKLEMFDGQPTGDLTEATAVEGRLVNLPSSARLEDLG